MFAPHFPPRRGPEALVNGKLAIAMLREGWNLDVISMANNIGEAGLEDEKCWDILKGITYSVPQPYPERLRLILDRAVGILLTGYAISGITWTHYALGMAGILAKNKGYDVVISRCQPAFGHLPAMVFSCKRKIPWIANWNDPTPPVRSPIPYGEGPKAPIGFQWRRYLTSVIRFSSWHVFPSEDLKNYMVEMYPGMDGKASVIPHIALSILKDPPSPKQNIFSLCHVGSLEPQRNLRTFFDGLSKFLSTIPDKDSVQVNLVGDHLQDSKTLSIYPEIRKNIQLKGYLNYLDSLKKMAEATVLLIIEAAFEKGILLPSKFVDYVQIGRPILSVSPQIGTISDLLKKYGGGIAVDCSSPNEIAIGLGKLYASWKKGSIDANYGSKRLFDLFSEDTVLSKYQEIFDHISVGCSQ